MTLKRSALSRVSREQVGELGRMITASSLGEHVSLFLEHQTRSRLTVNFLLGRPGEDVPEVLILLGIPVDLLHVSRQAPRGTGAAGAGDWDTDGRRVDEAIARDRYPDKHHVLRLGHLGRSQSVERRARRLQSPDAFESRSPLRVGLPYR